jgi:hypothetical protein
VWHHVSGHLCTDEVAHAQEIHIVYVHIPARLHWDIVSWIFHRAFASYIRPLTIFNIR